MDKLKQLWKRNKSGFWQVVVSFASVWAFLLYVQVAFSSQHLSQTEIFLTLWKPLVVLGVVTVWAGWSMRE